MTSLLEDREGTVWAGHAGRPTGDPDRPAVRNPKRAARNATDRMAPSASFVWSLDEDSSGALWAGAESGLWRWKPGPPKRYAMPQMRIADLTKSDDGRLLIAVSGGGLRQVVGDKLESYPIRSANRLRSGAAPDRDVDSNKLLRDRDGGLWIGTVAAGAHPCA